MVTMIHQSINEARPLAGRGGERLTNALTSVAAGHPDQQGQRLLVSDTQLATLLKKMAPEIHFGPANACIFDEATALCRISASNAVQGPLLGLCQPARCPNAVIGPQHLPVWISERQMLTAAIQTGSPSPPRVKALSARLGEVDHVLRQARADCTDATDEQ